MDETPGRCISCGFLSQHRPSFVPEEAYLEVELEDRDEPEILYDLPVLHGQPTRAGDRVFIESYLVCFRRKADLFSAVTALTERDPRDEPLSLSMAVGAVLGEDRRCPHYVQYEPGLNPKEHLMERRLTALEEDRRAFQKALDAGGKRLTMAALILGSLLALGQIIAALVAMTPDAYGAKWFQYLWSAPQIERKK